MKPILPYRALASSKKEELGVETFQHLHGAVIRKIEGKFYIIAQSWNPGDIIILEQIAE